MSTENYLRELRWKEINALRAENARLREEIERLREQRDKWCKAYEGVANENAKLRDILAKLKSTHWDLENDALAS